MFVNESEKARKIDLLTYQINEIIDADLGEIVSDEPIEKYVIGDEMIPEFTIGKTEIYIDNAMFFHSLLSSGSGVRIPGGSPK